MDIIPPIEAIYREREKYVRDMEDYLNKLKNGNVNKMKRKPITWYALWKRIGKQSIHKTRNTKVQIMMNGELKECMLVFTNNGFDFHLEIV